MKKLLAAVCLFVSSGVASAQSVQTYDQGWYTILGYHESDLANYIAGNCVCDGSDGVFRNFFTFELSAISQDVLAAALVIWMPEDGFNSADVHEEYELFDVVTDLSALLDGTGGVVAFDDLGSGRTYGGIALNETSEMSCVTIPLNQAALDDINAATGFFSIGGALTSQDGDPFTDEYAFGFSGFPFPQLLLDVDDSTTQSVLVIGDGAGLASFRTTNAVFPTQLDRVEDFAILGAELPSYPLPDRVVTAPPLEIPTDPTAESGARYAQAPFWMTDRRFTAQLLIHDPESHPAQPFRWSEGLQIRIRRDGSVVSTPFGQSNGVDLRLEVFEDERGAQRIRFPYSAPVPGAPPVDGAKSPAAKPVPR